jgi:hypothetical protein
MKREYENLTNVLDDTGIGYFERELEFVKAQTYDIKYPELDFANGSLIPISTSTDPGAKTIVYYTWDQTGMAKILANYADDAPRVGVNKKQTIAQVRNIGESYAYSVDDIYTGTYTGQPLDPRLAAAARRADAQMLNSIALIGDDEHGLLGILNNPNVPSTTVPNDGTGSTTTWSTKTPAQIIRDMNLIVDAIVTITKKVEIPDTLLLPQAQYSLIANNKYSDSSDVTILSWFLNNTKYIKNVESVVELTGAGTAGVDVMIAYRVDPMALQLEIPLAFTQLPVQAQNYEFVVNCLSKTGGVSIYYPLSLNIGEGI